MTRLVKFIDGWILAKVEGTSHKIQTLAGWDCYLQARFCHLLAGGFLLRAILALAPSLPWVFNLGVGLIYALAAAFYLLLSLGALSRLDDWRRSHAERGFRNPAKAEPVSQQIRVQLLFVCLVATLYPSIGPGQLYCAVLGLYLRACDPLPPCRGKARDWLDRARLVPNLAARR